MKAASLPCRRAQRGVTAVEFALVASALFILLIGIMEMGRVLFYWNTAAEVTRIGARLAVVCSQNDGVIKAKMIALFPTLNTANITIDYLPAGCTAADCELITASIAPGVQINTVIPFVPLTLTMPAFSTTLTREGMDSSGGNPVCQ